MIQKSTGLESRKLATEVMLLKELDTAKEVAIARSLARREHAVPKGQRSCATAMAHQLSTGKSVVERVQPSLQTGSERAVESASPTPAMGTERREASPPPTTVGRARSRVQVMERGVERQSTLSVANPRTDKQTGYSNDYNVSRYR